MYPMDQLQWQFSTITEGLRLFDERACDFFTPHGYDLRDLRRLQLAYEEAIVNAVRHGNQDDPEKSVTVSLTCTAAHVRILVEDQGRGFDLAAVPDPCAPENLESPTGRGLLIMRSLMSNMTTQQTRNGMRVTLHYAKDG